MATGAKQTKPKAAKARYDRAQVQRLVDQELTYKQIGAQIGGVSGERARQVIQMLGIRSAGRKRGRRPKAIPVTTDELRLLYYGDKRRHQEPLPLQTLASRLGVSTNKLRRVLVSLGFTKREAIVRPRPRASRKYDPDKIRELYVEKRWSDQRIAEWYRSSKGVKAWAPYIHLIRKKNGITRPPLTAAQRRNAKGDVADKLERLLRAGKTPKQIAREVSISSSYVYRLAHRYGLSALLPRHRTGRDGS